MKEPLANTNLDFLSEGGEMGERIRNFDWSKTPLGKPETWESSLKTCVRIMLTSPQPMFVWWGEELINLYNDAFRDVIGVKHPDVLGISGKIAWKEIWNELWIRAKIVFEKNQGTFDEALLLIMNRHGYDEETYFKFSYNPIPGTKKTTEGLFCVCTEETPRIINERALDTLRKLGAIKFTEKTLDIIYRNVAEVLGSNNKDFPFALVYKITGDANTFTVAASTGIGKNQHVFPDNIDVTKPNAITKDFCEAFRTNEIVVSEILEDTQPLPTGAWKIAPKQFIHIPISPAGRSDPYCIISTALNPYRKFDAKFLQLCQLIDDRVSIEINKMLVLEIETQKSKALAEIDKAKIIFISNISHEFRTPLSLILSPLDEILSKTNNFNKEEKKHIEIAQRNAMRLQKLVNTLLDFNSIEKGRYEAKFDLVDMVGLTKNLAANFRSIIENAGLRLIVKADQNIQPVHLDIQMWEKIVFNLLSNAFKYTLKGNITVELSSEKDFAVMKVKDTGVGIPENERSKIFERFHRVRNIAGRTYEGSGIGLSLVKELVHMHLGSIHVESELNKGSVFVVKIPFGNEQLIGNPILKAETNAGRIAAEAYIAEMETLLETQKKETFYISPEKDILPTILFVDDNADMREHIGSILSRHFNVLTANNGMDALNAIKKTPPALVLTDIMMPVMDGFDLLKAIKSDNATSNIPVILLTARAGEESKMEGWTSGADDYVVKPFSAKELIARINTQINIYAKRNKALHDLYSLFDELPFAVTVLKGKTLNIEFINKYVLNLWEQKREDVLGKPLFVVRPGLEKSVKFIHKEIFKTGKQFNANEIPVLVHQNGREETRYFNAVIDPMFDESGKVVGELAASVDVTDLVLTRKKVEDSETQLQLITDALPVLITYIDTNRTYRFNNKAYETWFGRSSADIYGKHLKDVLGEAAYINLKPKVDEVLSGKRVHFEMAVPYKDGGTRWVKADYIPHFGKDKAVLGFYGMITDINAIKKAEALNFQLAAIVQSSADAIVSMTLDGITTSWNAGAEKMFGYSATEMVGGPISRLVPDERIGEISRVLNQIKHGKPVASFVTQRLTKKGKLIDIFLTVSPIKDGEGKIIGASKIASDISRDIKARKKIEESEKRFNTLANNIQNLAWIADGEGRISWYNQRWYEYTGSNFEEMKGSGWQKFHHPDHLERIVALSKTLWSTKEPFELSFPLRRHDGEYRWFLTRGVPIVDENGKIISWLGTNTDIEEQKSFSEQLEEKVNERTFQLNEVNKNLEERNIELQKANKELEAFNFITSHDLQEPLRKIQTFSNRIADTEKDQLSENAKIYFERMNDAASRMRALIRDLLLFSHVNNSERIFVKSDLSQIVDELKEEFKEALEEKNACIQTIGTCEANIIPFQFRQLMFNLIDNALKFSKQDVPPRIIINSELLTGPNSPFENLDACRVTVSDNGIGFDQQYSENIFGVFQRLHNKDQYSGTGIGLAIVKKIVENHNGIITAESELGEGTTFNMYFPV